MEDEALNDAIAEHSVRTARPLAGVARSLALFFPLALLLLLSLLAVQGCTALQVRDFTRQHYHAPELTRVPARVVAAQPSHVLAWLLDELEQSGAVIEDLDETAGRIVAIMQFRTAAARDAALRMGELREVVTRRHRRYRSWWPLDVRCDECIIRKADITAERTELVSDRVVALDPATYQITARLRATVLASHGGSEIRLALELVARPSRPPGLAPVSTGQLEDALLDAITARVEASPGGG